MWRGFQGATCNFIVRRYVEQLMRGRYLYHKRHPQSLYVTVLLTLFVRISPQRNTVILHPGALSVKPRQVR